MICKPKNIWYVEFSWRQWGRHKFSTGSGNKARAQDMERMLKRFRADQPHYIGLLCEGKLKLPELYAAWHANPAALEQLRARAESPRLGDLVDKWLDHIASRAGISPRSKRRYAPRSVQRYRVSWAGLFAVLPNGQDSRLSDLTRGFVLDYLRTRVRAVGGRQRKDVPSRPLAGSTVNKDLAAVGAFMTWAADVEGLCFDRPKLPRERESSGRERWLTADELNAFERHCPVEWRPFFAVLFLTGARVGEALGLRGGDIHLSAKPKTITISDRHRRLKTVTSGRDVPISEDLDRALAPHLVRVAPHQTGLVFPEEYQGEKAYRRVWDAVCRDADIQEATPRDARHTFGVHAAQSGVPLARLQKLMGHASPIMTMRYMQHATESYMDEDGAAIAANMRKTDAEQEARIEAARRGMRAS